MEQSWKLMLLSPSWERVLDICIPSRKGFFIIFFFYDKEGGFQFVFKVSYNFHVHSILLVTRAGLNQYNTEYRAVFCNSITTQLHVVYIQRWGKRRNLQKDLVQRVGWPALPRSYVSIISTCCGCGEMVTGVRGENREWGWTLWSDHRPRSKELQLPPWPCTADCWVPATRSSHLQNVTAQALTALAISAEGC